MKVYTKTGDKGTTGLLGGTRVLKSDLRIGAYGTVDELNSHVGMVRDQVVCIPKADELIDIQNTLFVIGSHLASDPEKSKVQIPDITTDICVCCYLKPSLSLQIYKSADDL